MRFKIRFMWFLDCHVEGTVKLSSFIIWACSSVPCLSSGFRGKFSGAPVYYMEVTAEIYFHSILLRSLGSFRACIIVPKGISMCMNHNLCRRRYEWGWVFSQHGDNASFIPSSTFVSINTIHFRPPSLVPPPRPLDFSSFINTNFCLVYHLKLWNMYFCVFISI